jgi:hypothetical protein
MAVANTVAEPVVLVIHQTSANWTSAEPINEKACPVHMVKNLAAQRSGIGEAWVGEAVDFSMMVSVQSSVSEMVFPVCIIRTFPCNVIPLNG